MAVFPYCASAQQTPGLRLRPLVALLAGLALLAIPAWAAAQTAQVAHPAPWLGVADNDIPCRGTQGVGPLDYTNASDRSSELFALVERFHFSAQVEQLVGDNLAGNLDYTLRGIPNHHRALYAMMRYQMRQGSKSELIKHQAPPTECYMQRAVNFAPHDVKARLLWGISAHRKGNLDAALGIYQDAEALGEDPEVTYNLGLVLYDLGQYTEAEGYARKAYDQGYPLDGLRKKLAEQGIVVESD